MEALGNRTPASDAVAYLNHHINDDQAQLTQTPKISVYEQSRERRIKENLQRMEKLGILDLSLKLKSGRLPSKPTPKRPKNRQTPQKYSSVEPLEPPRRSSRLQNATPISYSELRLPNKDNFLKNEEVLQEEGSKAEVYAEKHEKLLGNTQKSWTFFVDGYGADGRRIYDAVKGKTCHQCRQKTLGHRTHCSKCNLVQGQFCGDCLYMRYGEHVLEALQNPDWICPVCRGICNCSLCRQAKGWAPTGPLYRKISKLGFKSVAHYLIQTKQQNSLENESGTHGIVSAKRSLPFSDIDAPTEWKEYAESNDGNRVLLKPDSEGKKDEGLNDEGKETHYSDKKHGDSCIAQGSSPNLEKIPSPTYPSADGIAGILQKRSGKCNDHNREQFTKDNEEILDVAEQDAVNNSSENAPASEPSRECGRLKRHKGYNCVGEELMGIKEEILDPKFAVSNLSSKYDAEFNKKLSTATNSRLDCIAGRLRSRRKIT